MLNLIKKRFFIKILITFIFLGIILVLFLKSKQFWPAEKPFLIIGDTKIYLEIADTDEKRTKGLSGREYLAKNQGMLFIFPKPDFYRFWMPNMHFPIDIVWIADNKVVGIENNVSNDFDPSNPIFYQPNQPVQYVLEVNAGFCERNGIKINDNVVFGQKIKNLKIEGF